MLQLSCALGFNTIKKGFVPFLRGIKMTSLERIIANNDAAEELLNALREEFKAIRDEKARQRIEELKTENTLLRVQVEAARQKLINLESKHGKSQINVPGQPTVDITPVVTVKSSKQEKLTEQTIVESKPQKEKKPKKEKVANETKAAPSGAPDELPIDAGRLDMRVGKIVEISRHPDADSLYLEKIDCGESVPRTVISGLVKFIPIEQMQNRMVIVLCNLKPAKMRGILSEGMVMCASTPEKVEVLSPPEGALPGDLVHVEGYTRAPDAVMNPKKKIFETVAPDLHTNEKLVACYKEGAFIVPSKGHVMSQTLKNVCVK